MVTLRPMEKEEEEVVGVSGDSLNSYSGVSSLVLFCTLESVRDLFLSLGTL